MGILTLSQDLEIYFYSGNNTLPEANPLLLLKERDGTKGIKLMKKANEFSNGFDVNLLNGK